MSIEIRHRWNNDSVLYTAESATDVRAALEEAAVERAHLQGADLRGADLRRAHLQGADLQGADLRGADLQGADLQRADLQRAHLQGAHLRGAHLRGAKGINPAGAAHWRHTLWSTRQDLFSILDQAPAEVKQLRQAMLDGGIDGSTYEGECSCLAGTIATAHGCNVGDLTAALGIEMNCNRLAEQWFIDIRQGDKPIEITEDARYPTEGVFRISAALLWLSEWEQSRYAIARVLAHA